jgi:hypothetical protein
VFIFLGLGIGFVKSVFANLRLRAVFLKNIPHLVPFSNKYPLQRDIFCMCEALLLFGWLGFGWSEVGLIWFGVVLLCSAIVAQLSCHYVPLLCFAQVLIFGYKVLRVVSLHCASYRFTLLVARRTKVLLFGYPSYALAKARTVLLLYRNSSSYLV